MAADGDRQNIGLHGEDKIAQSLAPGRLSGSDGCAFIPDNQGHGDEDIFTVLGEDVVGAGRVGIQNAVGQEEFLRRDKTAVVKEGDVIDILIDTDADPVSRLVMMT